MGWVLTKGLQSLRAQVDAAFPGRDKTSDGTVGDQAHSSGTSGHNPDLTGSAEYKDGDGLDEVRAWDMDSDLHFAGVTAQMVVDHIRKLPNVSSVLRYMIYNHKIYEASNGWAARDYTGPSPHTEHIHYSGAYSQAADSNTTFDYRLNELTGGDDMFLPQKGDSGEPVKYWQYVLNDLGFSVGAIDGDYGPKTEAAVNASRAAYGEGPHTMITGWHAFKLQCDLAIENAAAGKPGPTGPEGPPGPPGPKGDPGTGGSTSGTLIVTGGQLDVVAAPAQP